jgi:hypothetical protein
MDGTLFTERGNVDVIRRKESELIADGYRNVEVVHPFRLRVWEYTVRQTPMSQGSLTKQVIYWMKPDIP